jgi:tetratricopeptide (TPR) repeat protein
MALKIIQIIALLAGLIFAMLAFLPQGQKDIMGISTWIVAAVLLLIAAVPQVLKFFEKPPPVKIDPEEKAELRESTKRAVIEGLQEFHDGLPDTDNEELQRLYKLGLEEEARAAKIAEAIQRGKQEETKQYAEATLKAIECYQKGLAVDPKTSERCALYNLIGISHYRISPFDEAIEALEESAELAQEMISDKANSEEGQLALAVASGNVSNVYVIRGDLDKAEEKPRRLG